jgi:hypothetical protein
VTLRRVVWLGEEECADAHGAEREDPQPAEGSGGHGLVEDDRSRCDRQCVGEQGGDAG